MKIIKYIIEGLISCIDSWSGAESNVSFTQSMVGLLFLGLCIAVFLISLFTIDRKTNLKFYKVLLLSFSITAVFVIIFFSICLIISNFI